MAKQYAPVVVAVVSGRKPENGLPSYRNRVRQRRDRVQSSRVVPRGGFGAASVCALIASACGGDDATARCIERFNSSANEMRNLVANGVTNGGPRKAGFRAPVWLGESKVRPEKCVAVVGLDDQDDIIVVRENFNEGAEPGTWYALPSESEGGFQEMAARVREPVALGKPDGTIEAK
jgi:hypothetical protein